MKRRITACAAIISVMLLLAAVGCAPKNPAEQTKEMAEMKAAAGETTAPATADRHRMNPETEKMAPTAAKATAQAGAPEPAQGQGTFDKKIYFDYNKADITAESEQVLTELVDFLNANDGLKVQISGNCDERGTNEYNLALGDRRARAAKEYCVSKGIEAQKMSTISYGEEKPVDPGHNEEAWAKNRRDEFTFGK